MGVVVLIRKCRARVVEEVRKRYLHQARGKESVRGVCVVRSCVRCLFGFLSRSLSRLIESLSLGLSQRNLPLVELENDSGTVTGQAAVAEYSQGLRETGVGRSRAASRDESIGRQPSAGCLGALSRDLRLTATRLNRPPGG